MFLRMVGEYGPRTLSNNITIYSPSDMYHKHGDTTKLSCSAKSKTQMNEASFSQEIVQIQTCIVANIS